MRATDDTFIHTRAACGVLKGKAGVDDDYSDIFQHQRGHHGTLFPGLEFFLRLTAFTMIEAAS